MSKTLSVHDDLPDLMIGHRSFTFMLHSLGITITHTALPRQDAACLDPHTRTLHLNDTASTAEHVHAMSAIWRLLVLGNHVSPAEPVPPARSLHAV